MSHIRKTLAKLESAGPMTPNHKKVVEMFFGKGYEIDHCTDKSTFIKLKGQKESEFINVLKDLDDSTRVKVLINGDRYTISNKDDFSKVMKVIETGDDGYDKNKMEGAQENFKSVEDMMPRMVTTMTDAIGSVLRSEYKLGEYGVDNDNCRSFVYSKKPDYIPECIIILKVTNKLQLEVFIAKINTDVSEYPSDSEQQKLVDEFGKNSQFGLDKYDWIIEDSAVVLINPKFDTVSNEAMKRRNK